MSMLVSPFPFLLLSSPFPPYSFILPLSLSPPLFLFHHSLSFSETRQSVHVISLSLFLSLRNSPICPFSLSLSLSETLQYVSSLSICAMFQTNSYEAPGIAVFMNINASFVKCEMANVYDNGNDTQYVVLSFNQHKLFTLPHVT